MNFFHKSPIMRHKYFQLNKIRTNLNNINGNKIKISKPLYLITDKDNKKISPIKIYNGLYTYNEDLDTIITNSVSNKSLNEFNFKKREKIRLVENMTNKNLKKISLIDSNPCSNKIKKLVNSSKNIKISLPSPKNQNFKVILKKNRNIEKKHKYKYLKKDLFLNKNRINHKLSNNRTINSFGKSSKKQFEKRIAKTITQRSSISRNKKTGEDIKIGINGVYKGKKGNLDNNKEDINNKEIRKIKSNQNFLNNQYHIPISKYTNNTKLLGDGYYLISSNTNVNSNKKSFPKEKNKDFKKAYFKRNGFIKKILNKTSSNKSLQNKILNSTVNKLIKFKSKNEKFKISNYTDKNIRINSGINYSNKTTRTRTSITKKESYKNFIRTKNKKNKLMIKDKNKLLEKKNNMLKINTDNINNEKERILMDNYEHLQLEQFNTLNVKNVPFIKKQDKKSNNNFNLNKNENLSINEELNSLERNSIPFKINKETINDLAQIKSLNLKMKMKIYKSFNKREKRYKLFELLKCDNFIKIIFSFCESDINLLNKISIISKDIFRKIKPFLYKKISSIINKLHSNISAKNNIKKYIMQNNSALSKLSPAILYIKYNDLLLENNKFSNEIKKDLTRTFPDNILFKYGNIYYNKLYHILTAYSNFNKSIGYVQGINYIAGQIIYIFENEIDELIFLDALINKSELDKILGNNLNNEYYEKIFKNINLFLAKQLPRLDTFLSDIKLDIEFFTTNWILTLFSDSMDIEFLVIIWDYMIIFGWKFVKFFILNILLKFENDIINSTQSDLTNTKKNLLRSDKFKTNFLKILKDTEQLLISDANIILI